MRRNPFEELEELFERMEAQFESGMGQKRASVAVDVVDRGDEYEVTVDLPGYEAEDVDLTFADGRLHLSAERDESSEFEEDRYLRRERRRRSVERTVTVPDRVDEESIEASFENGVLTVTLPKEDTGGDGRRIEIE